MFDFKKYIELDNCHKMKKKLRNAVYKAEARFDKTGNNKDNELWEAAITASHNYTINIYSEKVYKTFSKIRPLLFNRRMKENVQWQNVFKDDFSQLSEDDKVGLVCMIEEDGGIYRLPSEYYMQKK